MHQVIKFMATFIRVFYIARGRKESQRVGKTCCPNSVTDATQMKPSRIAIKLFITDTTRETLKGYGRKVEILQGINGCLREKTGSSEMQNSKIERGEVHSLCDKRQC